MASEQRTVIMNEESLFRFAYLVFGFCADQEAGWAIQA
jgi:hypothetical protein